MSTSDIGWYRRSLSEAKRERIARNFTRFEHQCKCNDEGCLWQPCHVELYRMLDRVRDIVGLPIRINSGYRCVKHNAAVGGSEGSRHIHGKAVDIVTLKSFDPATLARAGMKAGFNGIGVYKTWVHLDIRDTPARWGPLQ